MFLHASSFDYWTEQVLPGPFDSYFTDIAGETSHPEFSITANYGRDHSSGLRLFTAGFHVEGRGQLYKFLRSLTGCVVGFAFQMVTAYTFGSPYGSKRGVVPIAVFYDGITSQVTLAIDSAMRLVIYRGNTNSTLILSSTPSLHENVWHYIEVDLTIGNSTGSVAVYLDGKNIINATNLDTQYTGNTYITSVTLGGYTADTFPSVFNEYYFYFDDFYLLDHTAPNNAPLGDVQVAALLPASDGPRQEWEPSSGTIHYAMVNDTQPTFMTNYVQSGTVGAVDVYRYGTISVTSGTIHAIGMNLWSTKTDTTIIAIGGVVSDGATYSASSSSYLSFNEGYENIFFETNPITAARFTLSQLATYYFGIKRII